MVITVKNGHPQDAREEVLMASQEGCIAVIFLSRLRDPAPGYAETAERMAMLAREMPGFLGMHSVRDGDGSGITISWWRSEEDVARWRNHPEHLEAQRRGREEWYESWHMEVCRVQGTRTFP